MSAFRLSAPTVRNDLQTELKLENIYHFCAVLFDHFRFFFWRNSVESIPGQVFLVKQICDLSGTHLVKYRLNE